MNFLNQNKLHYIELTHSGTSVTVDEDETGAIAVAAHNTTGIVDVEVSGVFGGIVPGVIGIVCGANLVGSIIPVDATNFQINTKLISTAANFTAGKIRLALFNKG